MMFERSGAVQVHLGPPPASVVFISYGEGEFNRYANLCQICAGELLIWTI